MAQQQTWVAVSTQRTLAAGLDLLNVFNGIDSSRVIRVYRMMLLNSSVATAAAFKRINITRNSLVIGGSPANLTALHYNNVRLDGATSACYNQTLVSTAVMRSVFVQHQAVAPGGTTNGSFYLQVPYATLWDSGYLDSNVQPLTCPIGSNCGYGLVSVDTSGPLVDPLIEFTSEAS